jgi:hypothetical protein
VALVVGRRVDVDLDEPDVRVVEMLLGPVGVDQDVVGVSGNGPLGVSSGPASRRRLVSSCRKVASKSRAAIREVIDLA